MNKLKGHMIYEIENATMLNDPVDYLVINDFLPLKYAQELSDEFLEWESDDWHVYKNAIEDKKTCNQWNMFRATTYKYFLCVNSPTVCDAISKRFKLSLEADSGLHGGGQHCHSSSGNLNPHLDYSIHPKLGLERRVNMICYLTDDFVESDGGHFGLWGNESPKAPGNLIKEIAPHFNSAVIFNTSQNSWHGMSKKYNPDSPKLRKSLASYYVAEPREASQKHSRALFAPREDQQNDKEVKQQIASRVDEKNRESVYIVNEEK